MTHQFQLKKAALFLGIFLATSCQIRKESPLQLVDLTNPTPEASKEATVFEFDPNADLTFELLKKLSLDSCMACHSKGKNDMSTAEKFLALKSSILNAVTNDKMPPKLSRYSLLNGCQKQAIKSWVEDFEKTEPQDQGAKPRKLKDIPDCSSQSYPNKNASEGKPVELEKVEANFSNVKKELLANKCFGCHSVETNNGFTVLEFLDGINFLGLISATAEESKLYQVVISQDKEDRMPPSDSGIDPFTPEEVKFLKRWIDEGAKE